MGLGGSKDERVHFDDIVIKGKYLVPLTNVNTRSGDLQTVRKQVTAAKLQSDNYVQGLQNVSNRLARDADIIRSKQQGVGALLVVAKKSQASYRNKAAKMEALQQTGSSLGLAKNSTAAINAIRTRKL